MVDFYVLQATYNVFFAVPHSLLYLVNLGDTLVARLQAWAFDHNLFLLVFFYLLQIACNTQLSNHLLSFHLWNIAMCYKLPTYPISFFIGSLKDSINVVCN